MSCTLGLSHSLGRHHRGVPRHLISGDTLSQCAPPFFFLLFSLSNCPFGAFASSRETLSQCSPALTKEGAHYRSVPALFLFFPLHLPCWGFLLQPGRHYRSVPWPLKQEKRYRSASLAAKLSRITVARKKMHLCFLRGPDRWRGYMGFYGGGLRFGILGLPHRSSKSIDRTQTQAVTVLQKPPAEK